MKSRCSPPRGNTCRARRPVASASFLGGDCAWASRDRARPLPVRHPGRRRGSYGDHRYRPAGPWRTGAPARDHRHRPTRQGRPVEGDARHIERRGQVAKAGIHRHAGTRTGNHLGHAAQVQPRQHLGMRQTVGDGARRGPFPRHCPRAGARPSRRRPCARPARASRLPASACWPRWCHAGTPDRASAPPGQACRAAGRSRRRLCGRA